MDPRTVLRMFRLVLGLAGVALGAVPLFILYDLARGGTGLGLCPAGIDACEAGLFSVPRLVTLLVVALSVVLAGLRLVWLAERRHRRRRVPPGREE